MDEINLTAGVLRPLSGTTRLRSRESSGFSLVELLVVLAIIGVLATLGTPAILSATMGSTLSRAGQTVSSKFAQSRQEAVTKNHAVELRFFNLTGNATTGWRGLQIWRTDQTATGAVTVPLSKMTVLPDGVVISSDAGLSPLLNLLASQNTTTNPTAILGTTTLPAYGGVQYVGFRFRANGSTDSIIDSTHNFITLVNSNGLKAGVTPANYFTLQINPVTGKVMSFRP